MTDGGGPIRRPLGLARPTGSAPVVGAVRPAGAAPNGRWVAARGYPLALATILALSFAAFTLLAARQGHIALSPSTAFLLVAVWGLVFCALAALAAVGPDRLRGYGPGALWVWGNSGALGLVAVGGPLVQPLLLVAGLLGTLLAVPHVPRRVAAGVNVATVLGCAAVLGGRLAGFGPAGQVGGGALLLAGLTITLTVATVVVDRQVRRYRTVQAHNATLRSALRRSQELAVRDELTGLYNRRYLVSALKRQKSLADRGGEEFAVVFLDLDDFKRVNDSRGHEQGDRILHLLAGILTDAVREADCVARFGGEEFVLVLVGASDGQAALVADRVRAQFEAATQGGAAPALGVTISAGVTRYCQAEDIDTTLARADRALYAAKRAGRNRVVIEAATGARETV